MMDAGKNLNEWVADVYEKLSRETDDYFIYVMGIMRFTQTKSEKKKANAIWYKYHPIPPIKECKCFFI